MAAYGVSVDEINRILETTFAGCYGWSCLHEEATKSLTSFCVFDPKERNFESLQSLCIPAGWWREHSAFPVG